MTEDQFRELQELLRSVGSSPVTPRSKPPAPKRPDPVTGPLFVFMTLWGHCPSKKNLWQRGASGKMFLDGETKAEISRLTRQALFQWKYPGPVEHPEMTFKFVVAAQRQDRDGMVTTILDCLQAAGVLLNDNIKSNNGRMILEPCEIFKDADERVEIWIRKHDIA